jgi:8-oxo-dGTP diphosphatase
MEPEKCEGWEWVEWHQVAAWAGVIASDSDDDNRIGEGESTGMTLFLPLLNLFRQQPGFDPVASFHRA